MGKKIKNALSALGDMAVAIADRNSKIDDMTRELLRRGYRLDHVEARRVAAILVDHAEVTWK